MADGTTQYSVMPRPCAPAGLPPATANADIGESGCTSVVGFFVGAYVVLLFLSRRDYDLFSVWRHPNIFAAPVGGLVAAVCVLMFSLSFSQQNALRRAEAARQARTQAIDRDNLNTAAREAATVSRTLHELLTTSCDATLSTLVNLELACKYIPLAERELRANVYPAFWDAAERSAELLAVVSDDLRLITENARQYRRLLEDREHNFPAFL
jgi:hypothetical protein